MTNTNRRSFLLAGSGSFLTGLLMSSINKGIFSFRLSPKLQVVHPDFPAQDRASVSSVVGASHSNFETVKSLVEKRPALAKASIDWGFGDWESALGAATHMGKREIAEFLISYGARPNIYTYAMMGKVDTVRQMVDAMPGIQRIHGPHGITLLEHAEHRLWWDDVSPAEKAQVELTIEYLKSLGDVGIPETGEDISAEAKEKYLGKYVFGDGEDEYFMIKKNMRGMLAIGRGEGFGRGLLMTSPNVFAPGGAPAVKIVFSEENGMIKDLVIHDPEPLLRAVRG